MFIWPLPGGRRGGVRLWSPLLHEVENHGTRDLLGDRRHTTPQQPPCSHCGGPLTAAERPSGPSLWRLSSPPREPRLSRPQTPGTPHGPRPAGKDLLCRPGLRCLFPLEGNHESPGDKTDGPQDKSQIVPLKQSCEAYEWHPLSD